MHLIAAIRRSRNGRRTGRAKAKGMLALPVGLDLAVLRFEAFDVLAHRVEQKLEMLRRHDDPRVDARPWHARRYAGKVDDKLRGRMGDDREVRINTLRLFFSKFDLKLLLDRWWGWIVFGHKM